MTSSEAHEQREHGGNGGSIGEPRAASDPGAQEAHDPLSSGSPLNPGSGIPRNTILVGDCVATLNALPAGFAQTCVTSFPYWGLRDYGIHDQPGAIGLEPTLDEHLANCVKVGRSIRRALRDDGTLWLNYGDAYAATSTKVPGCKPKDLIGLAWEVAFALRDDGWWLRSDIPWCKPNAMPEPTTDRPARAHEYVFLLAKSERYFYDGEAVKVEATGTAHPRGRGVTPKSRKALAGVPVLLADGRPGAGQRLTKPAGDAHEMHVTARPRSNADFQAKTSAELVPFRNLRDYWIVPSQALELRACASCNGVYQSHEVVSAVVEGQDERQCPKCRDRTQWVDHFATFPEALVEPCVLAGTSAHGACAVCGAPWERQVKKSGGTTGKGWHQHEKDLVSGKAAIDHGSLAKVGAEPYRVETIGWHPTCECPPGRGRLPCVVLDPFGGSGTTGLVAKRLGRDFLLVELNPQYAEIARRRVAPAMNHRLDASNFSQDGLNP